MLVLKAKSRFVGDSDAGKEVDWERATELRTRLDTCHLEVKIQDFKTYTDWAPNESAEKGNKPIRSHFEEPTSSSPMRVALSPLSPDAHDTSYKCPPQPRAMSNLNGPVRKYSRMENFREEVVDTWESSNP